MARIVVGLVRSDRTPKNDYMKVERTDEQGRYVIAINHDRYPDPTDPTNAYPPSFYPGVMDQAQAQVITVGAGERLNEFAIRIPSKRTASVLKGTVVWSDGSPVAEADVLMLDVTEGESNVPQGLRADAQGKFAINGYTGQKLIIEARSNRRYVPSANGPQPMERTEKARITLERPTETVRLVITKLR